MDKKNETSTPEVTAKITWINDDPQSNKKAAANITIAKCFTIHGLSVMNSNKGLFVAMPTKVKQDQGGNKYYEIAHPVTASMRKAVSDKVIGAYNEAIQAQVAEKNQKRTEESVAEPEEKPFEIEAENEASEEAETEDESESETEDLVENEAEESGIVQIMG